MQLSQSHGELIPHLFRVIIIEAMNSKSAIIMNRDKKEGYLNRLDRWVLWVKERKEYLGLLSEEKVKSLLVKRYRKSIPVDYGY